MENNINEIMNNEEVTDVTTEIVETNSGSVLKTLAEAGVVVGIAYGIYKLTKLIVKKVKSRKEQKEIECDEYEVIDEPVEDDSDVEEND